jgi:hypothetical protein
MVLTRRVKQAIAEWYVLQMLELSWDGFKVHTHQGWNVGKPPYGYLAERHPHPVKAKREEGATKHRLVPDPTRGSVVTQIFAWRALERLSYDHIAERLNLDLDRYPPPEPVRREGYHPAIGAWTSTAVPFIARFFNERIFGPNRKTYLQDRSPRERLDGRLDSQIAALRRQIRELQQAETDLVNNSRHSRRLVTQTSTTNGAGASSSASPRSRNNAGRGPRS